MGATLIIIMMTRGPGVWRIIFFSQNNTHTHMPPWADRRLTYGNQSHSAVGQASCDSCLIITAVLGPFDALLRKSGEISFRDGCIQDFTSMYIYRAEILAAIRHSNLRALKWGIDLPNSQQGVAASLLQPFYFRQIEQSSICKECWTSA